MQNRSQDESPRGALCCCRQNRGGSFLPGRLKRRPPTSCCRAPRGLLAHLPATSHRLLGLSPIPRMPTSPPRAERGGEVSCGCHKIETKNWKRELTVPRRHEPKPLLGASRHLPPPSSSDWRRGSQHLYQLQAVAWGLKSGCPSWAVTAEGPLG